MAGYETVPAHPPLPTAWYFVFHAAGGQASALMSESGVGLRVACTRQKAGALAYGLPPPPAPAPPAAAAPPARPCAASSLAPRAAGGATNAPAPTSAAAVIVAF